MGEAIQATVAEVAEAVSGQVIGDGSLVLRGVERLEDAEEFHLSFLHRPEYRQQARSSRAGCVLVGSEDDLPDRTVIVTGDPYRAFAVAMGHFNPGGGEAAGISADASVHETAAVHETAHVGARAVVGVGSRVGARSEVRAGAVLGQDCVVGDDCVIHPGVTLYPRTRLGDRVVVHANAVLGADGFGYSSGADGHRKIPHVGCVVIEDDVEVGAGSCIDRAVLGETRIGAGTKMDNLVQVAHGVTVGPGSLLVSQSGISGSTELGAGCVLAGQSGVAGHLKLGAGARVAAKSAVFDDVPAGETVGGIPAVAHSRWKRIAVSLNKLPELLRRVRALEKGEG